MSAPTEAAATALTYRRDIDGLRAVAVLAVIGFHAFPSLVPGGFTGVDVFFVISGFLISHQLFAACDRGSFSIRDFYIRRIRRIFPALILVLAATAAFGWIALTPTEFRSLQQHLAASAFFSNNFLLWYEAGYFDAPSKAKPLLHLWSLGVEEQFYIVWPWVIFWCWRRRLNRTAVIGIITLLSFAVSLAMMSRFTPAAAFYMPHSRLWQLAAGAWLASLTLDGPDHVLRWTATGSIANAMATVGAGLVLAGFMTLGAAAATYPGWSALVPTIGTLLIIAAGSAWLNRKLLSASVAVFIGLVSYPLYLWHWPMLSFLSITEQGQAPRALILGALAWSFVLATLSYLLVERPVRSWIQTATPRRAAAIATVLFATGVTMAGATMSGRLLPPASVAAVPDEKAPVTLNDRACRALTGLQGGYCQQFVEGPAPIHTVLFGDSHAAHLFPGLGARLREKGENLIMLGEPLCPPFLNIERVTETGDSTCAAMNRQSFDYIAATPNIRHVVVAFRGGIYEGKEATGSTARVPGTTILGQPALEAGIAETVRQLIALGKRVTLVLPVPGLGFEMSECLGRPWAISPRPLRSPCAVPKTEVTAQQEWYRRFVAALAMRFPITIVDPLIALCDDRYCWAVAGGQPRYSDNNHLGTSGSTTVAAIFALGQ